MAEILFARLDEMTAAVLNLQNQINAIVPIDNPNIIALSLLDSSGGLLTQTAAATFTKRTLLGTAANITVTNGDGVAGNPTITLPTALTFTGKTVTGGTFSAPTLTTPALGTPTSGVATNLTGTAASLTAGNVTTNANLTGVITSLGNATSIASQTGTGSKFVVDTSPTLVTPILGIASATSINKVAFTAPATSATLTILNGKTLTVNNSLTLAGTDATTMTFPGTSDTIAGLAAAQTLTNKTLSTGSILTALTMTLGSDATGDLYYRAAGGALTRLGIGGSANVLTVTGGLPVWAAPAGGGNVSNTGTPTANQLAQWTNATTIQGVNASSIISAGYGNAVTGTTSLAVATSLTSLTNALTSNVALSNTANFFDGPVVAQGTSGTWFVSGTVTVSDASTAAFIAKLWDGTTVIASTEFVSLSTQGDATVALSGVISNPVGNLRISVKDLSTTAGIIGWNISLLGKDSTITAVRIA